MRIPVVFVIDVFVVLKLLVWAFLIAIVLPLAYYVVLMDQISPPMPADLETHIGEFRLKPSETELCIERWFDAEGGMWCRDSASKARTW